MISRASTYQFLCYLPYNITLWTTLLFTSTTFNSFSSISNIHKLFLTKKNRNLISYGSTLVKWASWSWAFCVVSVSSYPPPFPESDSPNIQCHVRWSASLSGGVSLLKAALLNRTNFPSLNDYLQISTFHRSVVYLVTFQRCFHGYYSTDYWSALSYTASLIDPFHWLSSILCPTLLIKSKHF